MQIQHPPQPNHATLSKGLLQRTKEQLKVNHIEVKQQERSQSYIGTAYSQQRPGDQRSTPNRPQWLAPRHRQLSSLKSTSRAVEQ